MYRYKKLLVEIDNMSQRLMRVTQKPLTSEEMVEIELWLIGMQSSVNRVRELHRKTQVSVYFEQLSFATCFVNFCILCYESF